MRFGPSFRAMQAYEELCRDMKGIIYLGDMTRGVAQGAVSVSSGDSEIKRSASVVLDDRRVCG
jgi:hypothetical protein